MKKIFVILLFVVQSFAYAQVVPVHDSYFDTQRSSHYMPGVWEHSPKWLYNTIHRRYVRNYNNNPTQWFPLVAAENVAENGVDSNKKFHDTIAKQKGFEWLGRTVDAAFLMELITINSLKQRFLDSYLSYKNSESPNCEENSIQLLNQYDVIIDNIKTVNKAHVEVAKKREEYIAYEQQLDQLIGIVERLNRAVQICKELNIKH